MRIAWSGARWRRRLARLCVWLAIATAVAAAAQPSVTVAPTGREGILELVLDVSGSTNAEDVAPSRLGAMQVAVSRLLDQVPPRVRIGLVSFSDSATSLVRPTTDRGVVRRRTQTLSAVGGTAIDEERRLAVKIGGARLLEYVTSSYGLLDRSGHWKSQP